MAQPFASESIEPFAGTIMNILAGTVLDAGDDDFAFHDALCSMWWGVRGLEKIAMAVRGGRTSEDPSGLHFSIAASNEVYRVRSVIMDRLNLDPFTMPGWMEA